LPSDPHLLCVSPENFSQHLDIIRKYFHPLSLQRLKRPIYAKDFIRRAVVITFDDGYADNLYNAKPLLERYGLPATFFVTNACSSGKGIFWWDELNRLWDPLNPQVYRSAWQMLKPLAENQRKEKLDKLLRQTENPLVYSDYRLLSIEDLVRLSGNSLFEIGAHSVSHPILSVLPFAEQREEIRKSREFLRTILANPVLSFAYPYGDKSTYNDDTRVILQEAGFNCACTTMSGTLNRLYSYPFQLPRMMVSDCNGDTFQKYLEEWFRY
jgi:peptidoglycan/xylan/chitin deacetylase (PgdA/CDA1 family)